MRRILLALGLLFAASPALAQNYNATAGSGLTFGSKLVTAVNYPQVVFCDPTTPAQCVGVNASGQITVVGNGTFVTQSTLAAETTKNIGTIRVTGNVGGVLDAIGQNVAVPANWLQAGCQFNTTPTTLTTGNGSPCQIDSTGNLLTNVKTSVLPTGASTSANQTSQITQETASATALGTPTDAVATVPTSGTSATVVSLVKALTNVANSATPACAAAPCVTTIGNVGMDPSSGKGTPSSVAINVASNTTTQLVAISGSTSIYVTSFDVIAGGTGNITFEYGTGASCGTGTTALTGAYPLVAQAGISKGDGNGTILKVPSGNALCILTSAAVQMSGSVSYQQF